MSHSTGRPFVRAAGRHLGPLSEPTGVVVLTCCPCPLRTATDTRGACGPLASDGPGPFRFVQPGGLPFRCHGEPEPLVPRLSLVLPLFLVCGPGLQRCPGRSRDPKNLTPHELNRGEEAPMNLFGVLGREADPDLVRAGRVVGK